jgi:hypothetical protein
MHSCCVVEIRDFVASALHPGSTMYRGFQFINTPNTTLYSYSDMIYRNPGLWNWIKYPLKSRLGLWLTHHAVTTCCLCAATTLCAHWKCISQDNMTSISTHHYVASVWISPGRNVQEWWRDSLPLCSIPELCCHTLPLTNCNSTWMLIGGPQKAEIAGNNSLNVWLIGVLAHWWGY